MNLNFDLDLLKDNLYEAAKDASSKWIEATEEQAKEFYDDLRDYTDNLAQLQKELAEAADDEIKQIKLDSIELQQHAISSLVDKHRMIINQQAIEQLKEVLKTVAVTVGKVGLSLLLAAV